MKYTNKTTYAIQMIEIWNTSESRQEAYARVQDQLDENLSYAKMMNKITYAQRCGVQLEDLQWDCTDWSTVKNHFDTEGLAGDAFEIEE